MKASLSPSREKPTISPTLAGGSAQKRGRGGRAQLWLQFNAQYHTKPDGFAGEWTKQYTSAAHHLGTARMALDPSWGVVNTNLQVFGIDNLYVCNGSVFVTSGSANPSLTITALALRLGDHLLSKSAW